MNSNIEKYIEKEVLTYSNSNLILEIARADYHASKGILKTSDAVSAQNAREYFNKLVEKIEDANDRVFVSKFIKEWLRRETEEVIKGFQDTHKKVVEISNDDINEHLNSVQREWEEKRIKDKRLEMERQASSNGWHIDELVDSEEEVLDFPKPPSAIEEILAIGSIYQKYKEMKAGYDSYDKDYITTGTGLEQSVQQSV